MAAKAFQQSNKCKSCFNSLLTSNVICQNSLEYSQVRSCKLMPILTRNDSSSEITVCKRLSCCNDHGNCNPKNQRFNHHVLILKNCLYNGYDGAIIKKIMTTNFFLLLPNTVKLMKLMKLSCN